MVCIFFISEPFVDIVFRKDLNFILNSFSESFQKLSV
jgi:hypothetical protein